MTVGSLGLTDAEENQVVAFLETLTDGFTTPYPDIDMYRALACPAVRRRRKARHHYSDPASSALRTGHLRRSARAWSNPIP